MRFPILVLHVSAGILAMLAGGFAISFRKGSQRHRAAGTLFVICMLIVSVAGAWLAFRKSEADNVLGGIFTFYLIATAWATTRHGEGTIWKIDWVTPAAALAIAALWFFWGIGVTSGRMAAGQGSSAGGYFFFGGLAVLCAAGDVRMLQRRGISGRPRLMRHLWRMCFGWFIATISFFLGQQQVFPRWLRGSIVLIALAFLPLLFMIFWLVRVRFVASTETVGYRNGRRVS
ncbi:MAG TPA: DUF2306 domain-containing protein [Terracidiphilus sp.]|jgi:hypothetical protein|nr:DUF2306 domain-containing protein [Terracidiphilus sp.]